MDDEGDREGLFLTDDPVPRRSRPRWLDGLGLGAVVLGIVAIGVLGDRGSPERRPAPTTTTTTTAPPARLGPTTTTTSATTTTTTLVQQLEGHLAITTGATVLVATGSTLTLVDVDAATARRVPATASYGMVAVEDGFLLPIPGGLRLLPTDGGPIAELPVANEPTDIRILRAGPRSVWVFEAAQDPAIGTELDTTGRPTGGRIALPSGVYAFDAVDGGIIADAHGSIVFVDGRSGRARGLGTGTVVATGHRTLVRVSCVVLRCRTEVVDVRTGASRAVSVPETADYARQTLLSPDDRWLARSYTDGAVQRLLVVDLKSGRSWTGEGLDSQAPIAFSPGGEVVFTTSAGSLCAFEVATGHRSCLTGLQAGGPGQLAVALLGR